MSDHHIVPADQILPARLFLIPLRGKPAFPGILTPLVLPAAQDVETVEKAIAADSFIGLVLTTDGEQRKPHRGRPVRRWARPPRSCARSTFPTAGVNIFISTLKRFRIKQVLHAESPISVAVQYLEDENVDTAEVKALTRALHQRDEAGLGEQPPVLRGDAPDHGQHRPPGQDRRLHHLDPQHRAGRAAEDPRDARTSRSAWRRCSSSSRRSRSCSRSRRRSRSSSTRRSRRASASTS